MAKKLELKISEAVIGTSNETLAAVVWNFQCQLQTVMDAVVAHTENVYMKLSPKTTEHRHQI
jgi:hypothetical protein